MVKTRKNINIESEEEDYIKRIWYYYGFDNFSQTIRALIRAIMENKEVEELIFKMLENK